MRRATCTLAFVLGLAASAAAQDGGKLSWMGKTSDPKTAMLDARDQNRPIMLFFSSDGSAACAKLSAGAFSDQNVIEAARNVACVFVDCDWGKKNKELSTKFGVTTFPTVVFCDPQGNSLGRMEAREPDEVAEALTVLARKFGAKAVPDLLVVFGIDYDAALVDARRYSRPILLYFSDLSPASLSVNEAMLDRSLRDLHGKFTCAKSDFVKGSAQCVKFNVTRAPTILVLDSKLPKPEEKPLLRIEGSRTVRELRRELESALPSRTPGSVTLPEGSELPPVKRDVPQETLSDDQIERKFIWARVAVAQDTLKRGSKDKAIEILEDVLKSYPKHKDTEDVKKVLEDMRKK